MSTEWSDTLIGDLSAGKAVVGRTFHIGSLQMGGPGASRRRLISNLPPLNKKTVPRARLLNELHRALSQPQPTGVVTQVGLVGPGGVGKTALALKYAWDHLSDYPGGVFFLNCDNSGLVLALASLAPALGLPPDDARDRTAAAVKCELEVGPPCLLIFDNVAGNIAWQDWNDSAVLPVRPVRRLVTSRDPLHGVAPVRVGAVTRAEGVDILAGHRPDARRRANKASAERLVEWFDGLAVGLTVAGAYMALNPDVSWSDYVAALGARDDLRAVRHTEEAVGRLQDYEKRIDSVFDDLLTRLSVDERRALEYATLLPENWVVRSWLAALLRGDGVGLPERPGYPSGSGDATVAMLVHRQLLMQREQKGRALSLHRVLGRHLRERLAGDLAVRERLVERVTAHVCVRAEETEKGLARYTDHWELTPLVRALEALLAPDSSPAVVSPATRVADRLRDLGRYREAASLWRLVHPIYERSQGTDHPDTAKCLNNLGCLLQSLGDLKAAQPYYERALAINEKALGPDHLETAATLNNLGCLLSARGELAGARPYFERALAIKRQALAVDHSDIALSLSNLGYLLQGLEDLDGARECSERALAIFERSVGPDHPDTAATLSNLGHVFLVLGDLSRARTHYERALGIYERVLGADHPDTATVLSNLGSLLRGLGDPAGARTYFERAVANWERALGPEHPDTTKARRNLAELDAEATAPPG